MGIYTLSINFIGKVSENKSHFFNVLFKFPNPDNEFKAAMDKSKRLLDHYQTFAQENNDLFVWLDLMSRAPSSFEIIDIIVPEDIEEEEMYLMVASATKPHKKVIVSSHQYWKEFCYLDTCSKIVYQNQEVLVLDRDEAFKELNETNKIIVENNSTMEKKNNPWISGSFYLLAFLVIIFSLLSVTKLISPWFLAIIIIGSIILFVIVSSFQLKNDKQLADKAFIELIKLSLKQIPFIRSNSEKK
ncbi:hypothetical protein [Arcicella rosea]|uniref:Uncharacterized protein n=1 Tax=Arcicella rosea TaxID=502909 RepID=A0A841EN66_9BACT|nr:hypothetical protein [Arcicella rosea]MBB6002849.1 hypothetical protein [Arcicella rosea]